MYQERELVMTSEERIISLHERAKTLKRRRDRNILRVWGSLCAGLTTVLMIAASSLSGTSHTILKGAFTGTSMLSDRVGGYVLVGVVSFVLAVFITVLCMRKHRAGEERGHPKRGDQDEEPLSDKDDAARGWRNKEERRN